MEGIVSNHNHLEMNLKYHYESTIKSQRCTLKQDQSHAVIDQAWNNQNFFMIAWKPLKSTKFCIRQHKVLKGKRIKIHPYAILVFSYSCIYVFHFPNNLAFKLLWSFSSHLDFISCMEFIHEFQIIHKVFLTMGC